MIYNIQYTYYILESTCKLHHLFLNNDPNFSILVVVQSILKIAHAQPRYCNATLYRQQHAAQCKVKKCTVHFHFIIYCTGCPGSVQWVLVRLIALPRLNSDSEKWKTLWTILQNIIRNFVSRQTFKNTKKFIQKS